MNDSDFWSGYRHHRNKKNKCFFISFSFTLVLVWLTFLIVIGEAYNMSDGSIGVTASLEKNVKSFCFFSFLNLFVSEKSPSEGLKKKFR